MPKYDLVVVGAGLGGLAAAALASRMNKRTIVLDSRDSVGGVVAAHQRDGFVFQPGPALSFGFERGGAIQRLNESLGIAQNASLRSPCYQVALPDRRITVYAEQSETLEELAREFPDEIKTIQNFYHDLRKKAIRNAKNSLSKFLSDRRPAAGFLRAYRFSREFTSFLDVQSYYFFRRPAAAIRLSDLVMMCDSAPLTVDGGFKKVAEQMADVLLKNGGEIRHQVPMSAIDLAAHRISTPNGDIEAIAILMNTEQNGKTNVLCIGLREEVVPAGMSQEVLSVADYSHPDRFLTLSLGDKGDETTAPPGSRALTASFFNAEAILEGRKEQIRSLIPFLNDFLLLEEEYKPEPRSYPLPEGMLFKAARGDSLKLLSRSSVKRIYMLPDGAGTPAQSIAAAERFMEFIE